MKMFDGTFAELREVCGRDWRGLRCFGCNYQYNICLVFGARTRVSRNMEGWLRLMEESGRNSVSISQTARRSGC